MKKKFVKTIYHCHLVLNESISRNFWNEIIIILSNCTLAFVLWLILFQLGIYLFANNKLPIKSRSSTVGHFLMAPDCLWFEGNRFFRNFSHSSRKMGWFFSLFAKKRKREKCAALMDSFYMFIRGIQHLTNVLETLSVWGYI